MSKPKLVLHSLLEQFSEATKKPDVFLDIEEDIVSAFRLSTKILYDLTKSEEEDTTATNAALPELIIDDFDDEQVWQEIELQNDPTVGNLLHNVSQIVALRKKLGFGETREDIPVEKKKTKRRRKTKISSSEDDEDSGKEDAGSSDHAAEEEEEAEMEEEEREGGLQERDGLTLRDSDGDESLSDEELEMKTLLDKVSAGDRLGQGSDEDGDDGDALELDEEMEEENSEDEDDAQEADFDIHKDSLMDQIKDFKDKRKVTDNKPDVPRDKAAIQTDAVKKRKTIVDDKFFKMADMEAFLEQEDAKEERKIRKDGSKTGRMKEEDDDEDDLNMFADVPSDGDDGEEDGGIKYQDFFDAPDVDEASQLPTKKRKVHSKQDTHSNSDKSDEEEGEEEESGEDSEESEGEDVAEVLGGAKGQKSPFEMRQQRLKKTISDLEGAALEQKPWQLAGEVASAARPENSLLQEDLDFEHMSRLPPEVTEEKTQTLEDLIKQRIRDKAWDDVERKVKKVEEAFEYKKRVVLDQEKSKQSLGQIYEQEYLKQQQKEEAEHVDPDHEEIKKSMQLLFVKLDALSNFHYTPKPAAPELKIVSNLPSILVEEVAPVTVSEAAQLAPQEVQDKQKGELTGATELTKTDKKRDLRHKKKGQRTRQQERERRDQQRQKLRPDGSSGQQSKVKAMKELEKQSKSGKGVTLIKESKGSKKSGLTSSSKFFGQLQEEVTAHIQTRKAEKRKKTDKHQQSSAKFKL